MATCGVAVHVGPYQGYVNVGSDSTVVLYVEIPAAQTDHALVIVASDLTANQVIVIAESGLPSKIEPTTVCTSGCG
jgi:hypothetical protein